MSNIAIIYLGEEEVVVGYTVLGAEPDVGINAPYIEDYWIERPDGFIDRERTKRLTVAEHERIVDRLNEKLGEDYV